MASTTASGRRKRWAAAENAKRQAQHNMSLAQWERDEELLRLHHEMAVSARAIAVSPVEIQLRKQEAVLWSAAGVSMVEVPDTLTLYAPVHAVYSPLRQSAAYVSWWLQAGAVRDQGFVVVTNQRVVFVGGRGNKEWSFAKLTGVAHGVAAPMSLLRVSNRQRISGFVFDESTAAGFQFFLSLAVAEHQADRAGFSAHLAQLLAYHRSLRPLAPTLVSPDEAPHPIVSALRLGKRVYFGAPGASSLRQVMPSLASVVVVLCMCVALFSPANRPQQDETSPVSGLGRVEVVKTSAPPPLEAAPVPSPTPAAPTSAPAALPPPPPPTTTKAANLCGAPANPWGFHFCGGGKSIDDAPTEFCSYFDCIKSFWDSTNGYVIQCQDGMYSHSGGRQGSCSHHGGNKRALRAR